VRYLSTDLIRRLSRSACVGAGLLAVTGTLSAQQTAPAPEALPAQRTPASAAQQAPPPAKPPYLNRANELMPTWLRVRGEFRERVEGFDNSGFNESRDDMYYLSRFRFNATATSKLVAVTVQAQDARVGKKTVGPTGTPFKAAFDLRQAHADVGTLKSPVVGRVGRQELAFGDQRLLGHLNWTNAGRTFDAARVTFKSKAAQVDVFGASLVRILDGEFKPGSHILVTVAKGVLEFTAKR